VHHTALFQIKISLSIEKTNKSAFKCSFKVIKRIHADKSAVFFSLSAAAEREKKGSRRLARKNSADQKKKISGFFYLDQRGKKGLRR
jgi:hypothetical protein